MSCQGKPYDLKDLGRTPEQLKMMQELMPIILEGMTRGATPFGEQLSAPPDPSMFNAMNVMSMAGGQGPYQWPGMQTGPYTPPPGMTPGGGGGGGGGRPWNPGGGGGGVSPDPRRERWWDDPDPYGPRQRGPKLK